MIAPSQHRPTSDASSDAASPEDDARPGDVVIRPAGAGDLPALLAMIHALAAHHGERAEASVDTLRRDLVGAHGLLGADPVWGLALIATHAAAPIGYAVLHPKLRLERGERGMELHHLFVVEAWRSRGVGARLVEAAAALAAAHGCETMSVGARDDNARVHDFYENAGFERSGAAGPRWRRRI